MTSRHVTAVHDAYSSQEVLFTATVTVTEYKPVQHSYSKVKVQRYVDLYNALDDKNLVLKALRHGSHSLTCKQHYACL